MTKAKDIGRDLALAVIEKSIKSGNYLRAGEVVYEHDKQYNFPKVLAKKALTLAGNELLNREDYENAFLVFSRMHSMDSSNQRVFSNIIDCLEKYWVGVEAIILERGGLYFTEEDVTKYLEILNLLVNFHEVNYPNHSKVINKAKKFVAKLEYIKKYKAQKQIDPKKQIESLFTHRINVIYDAIYEEMTLEQVYQEAARLLAPSIRDFLSEKKKESDTEKDKSDKKKKKKPKKP